jgi:hypothetical protein
MCMALHTALHVLTKFTSEVSVVVFESSLVIVAYLVDTEIKAKLK